MTTTMTGYRPGFSNVSIVQDEGGAPRLQFDDGVDRYHVWLDRETLRPVSWGTGSIPLYANALEGHRLTHTRTLRADSARWRVVIDRLFSRLDLDAERRRLADETRQREETRAQEQKDAENKARVIAEASAMLALLRDAICYGCSRRYGDLAPSTDRCVSCRSPRALLARVDGAA